MGEIAKYSEDVLGKLPVFVVGSGLSVGAGISSMGKLAEWLIHNIHTDNLEENEVKEWESIKERLNTYGMGLEEALQVSGNQLTLRLTRLIVLETWRCIAIDERNPLLRIAMDEDVIGFVRLFRRFSDSTQKVVNIITTNYDHLLEWSAASAEWQVWDGFDTGLLARPLHSSALGTRMTRLVRNKKNLVPEPIRHLRLYKPHGSLCWFRTSNDKIIKLSGIGSSDLPTLEKLGLTPVIVTPGTGKYLETHFEPYNMVMAEMNNIIHSANAMIFLGFGFNDIHIQGSFDSILRNRNIPKIVLSRMLTPSFKSIIDNSQISNYVAVEQSGSDSRIYSDKIEEVIIQSSELWTLKGLLSEAWGEGM